DKLTRSRREIPEATVWVDVDATGLVEARRALNASASRPPGSLPALRGLVDPVVHAAHHLTPRELSAALTTRTEAARAGRLAPAELTGGTFTVNNYGVFGVDGSAAIINHPEVAILGIGRILDRPWVVGGQVTARKVCELTLAFDHRACDGGVAGGVPRHPGGWIGMPPFPRGGLRARA